MQIRIAVVLLMLAIGVPAAVAQTDASAEATESTETTESGTTTMSSTTTTITVTTRPSVPGWIPLVRMAATAGPIVFLVVAWIVGTFLHYRVARREQALFPVQRGSRAPQTTPIVFSAALFFIPLALFSFFEVRSRRELNLGIAGINDEWVPVSQHAWIALLVCLALALIPWLFAQRADTVAQGGA
jgi:hypothetical protein